MNAIDRFTAGITTRDQFEAEVIRSERDEAMTFAEFQQTGTDVRDMFSVSPDNCVAPESSGRVYLDNLWIEDTNSWTSDRFPGSGRWYVIIGRSEYRSDDLEAIERHLYDFAVSEGYEVKS